MDEQSKQTRLDTFEQKCRQEGVPLTAQRRAILDTVLDLDTHPTADQVHESVAGRLAGISRTTVYRTLETLVRMGVITKACHPGSVIRYDNRTELHHHLICLCCDEVLDFSDENLNAIPIPDTSGLGFEVSDFRVQLRGICRSCCEMEEES
jgi:Fur family peroxide stress response transcriptional regulator